MDVNVGVFGVCGIGGVGKTAIMKHVYNQLIEDSVFDSVIWVTVSRDSTLEELQNNILKCLGISLPMHVDEMRRLMVVYSALKRRKKFVLILDDMDRFYAQDIGIPRPDQEKCWRVEEIIEPREDSEAEMNKGYVIMADLQRACILEGLPNIAYGECIKMHDLIRDMAIDITRVHPLFVVRAGVGLEVAPKEEEWFKDVERISLMGNKIEMLSVNTVSFQFRKPTRARCLQLRKLPMLAKLKKLRVLDLVYAPLDELPQGLEALTNLRCLGLSTNKLQSFPPGIFYELSNLEELKMYGGHWRWSSRAITFGAKIEELTSLTRLADLTIHIEDLQTFVGFVSSRNWQAMKSFQLLVGSLSEFLPPPGNFIALYHCDLESEHLVIPDNTSALDIDECRIFCLSHLSCLSTAGKLKECFIKRCDEMQYVLMGNERTLSCLETSDLFSLPKLHALYNGSCLTWHPCKHEKIVYKEMQQPEESILS
ncbi:disease resistance-like protein [Cinnamomum micranthum f. kanehirae]|uniref:Disease resistance-like protein n=1 Tax=Cinnamomum micranthum f. kanehirae TaxID=337451 RepID=A0A3S3NI34_9MAGN|nr:disease resistance-like protein [Cinnamomum micranthum f. kanehirae]